MFDLKTQKEITGEAAVLLPHLLFSNLHENYPEEFDRLFCPHDSSAFWHGVEGAKDPRLVEPLAKSGKVLSPSKTIPIYIHGDGCEFHSRDSLMTWSWGCLLCKDKALQSHLLICAMPKSCSLPTTWQNIGMWLAWSLTALTKGTHPTKDPWNNPLPEGVLKDMAGKPLTKGSHRCAVWAIQGDHNFPAQCALGPQPGTCPAQCAPLDLNLGPSQLSVHRWTSTWDLPSSVCTAEPQPGTFPAQCAPLDLNLGPPQLSAHRWASTAR